MNPAESMKNSCYIWNMFSLAQQMALYNWRQNFFQIVRIGYKSSHFSLVICFVTHYKWSEFDHFSSRLSHFLTESHYRKNCSNASYFSFFYFKNIWRKITKVLECAMHPYRIHIIILSETDLPLELDNYRYFNFR